jgi:HPt (histidine-containing phosphotransfer) domain-containing protein
MESARDNFQALKDRINEQDSDGAGRAAHKLKGSAGNLGLMQLYAKLQLAESIAHEQNTEQLSALLAELEKAFSDALSALADWPQQA